MGRSRTNAAFILILSVVGCERARGKPDNAPSEATTKSTDIFDSGASARPWAAPPRDHNVTCTPTVRAGDTIVMRMEGAHGASFHIIAPDGLLYVVVFHGEGGRDRGNRKSLMPPESFARLQELRIDPAVLRAGVWHFGRDTNELVFRQRGTYRLVVGSDLETDGPVYAECRVRYMP